jgi:solute carrier family 25 protein 38
MDAYPAEYVVHNLPLVVLSGLNTTEEPEAPSPVQDVFPGRATTTIGSEIPPVTGERAQQLLQTLLSVADGSNVPWNGRGANGRSNIGFKIRTVGRVGQESLLSDTSGMHAHKTPGLQASP